MNPTPQELESACKLGRQEVGLDLKPLPKPPTAPPLQAATNQIILNALDQCGGNIAATARKLQVSRTTIYNRLEQLRMIGGPKPTNIIHIAACFLIICIFSGCSTPKPAETIKAAMELAPKRLVASQSSAIVGLPNTNTSSITLQWNAGPIGTPSGFKVLHGAGGSYTNSINVGNTLAATITGLKPATLYYFAVSAYNEDGFESEPSEEIAEMTPGIVLQPLLNLTPYILRLTISSLTPGKTNFLQFTTTPTAPFVWITELSFVPLDPVWGMFVTNDVPSKLYRVVVTP